MIGPAQIALLQQGSYVMVMSRGNIVDEPALIAGAQVRPDRRCWPGRDAHRAAAGRRSALEGAELHRHAAHVGRLRGRPGIYVWTIFEENLSRFERGEPLMNVVDKQLGY